MALARREASACFVEVHRVCQFDAHLAFRGDTARCCFSVTEQPAGEVTSAESSKLS